MKLGVPFQPLYPDVLGAITGGQRINMEALECALGTFPRQAYINQPVEVVLALQNMVDQTLQLKVAIRLPTTDRKGGVAVIETPKSQIAITLAPGEVGVLRMPVVARPPTQPGKDFPVRVAIRYRESAPGKAIRPPGGGVPPSILTVSPFKLQVLREIEYAAHKWNESTDIMTVYFDLAPRRMQQLPGELKPRYETLWTQDAMSKEVEMERKYFDEALEMATSTAYGSIYLSMFDAVEERFGARGLPLHPGEAMAIAKMMTYTVDDAPTREPDIVVENTRWFRGLCRVLANDSSLLEGDRNEIITKNVFEGVLYESILVAFTILQTRVKEDLGDKQERIGYANRLMTWFAGHGEADLSYVYLPLVLCGLAISRLVRHKSENPWDIYDQLIEAYNGRIRLVTGATGVVFDMLTELLDDYQRKLKSQRIERPD